MGGCNDATSIHTNVNLLIANLHPLGTYVRLEDSVVFVWIVKLFSNSSKITTCRFASQQLATMIVSSKGTNVHAELDHIKVQIQECHIAIPGIHNNRKGHIQCCFHQICHSLKFIHRTRLELVTWKRYLDIQSNRHVAITASTRKIVSTTGCFLPLLFIKQGRERTIP